MEEVVVNTSETYMVVLAGLANAVASARDPKKNAKNDHFKSRYADLGEVLDCIEGPLRDNGLVLTQTTAIDGDNTCLVTRVWHVESGEWLESCYPLKPDKAGPQGLGSCVTYARRYSIKALFGMWQVDDDGNAATVFKEKETARKPIPAKPAVEGFDNIETALAASKKVTNQRFFDAWKAKVQASGFKGTDLAEAMNRRDELQDELSPVGAS